MILLPHEVCMQGLALRSVHHLALTRLIRLAPA